MLINLCARPDGARASESTALGSASSRRVIKRVRRADDSGTVSCAHTQTYTDTRQHRSSQLRHCLGLCSQFSAALCPRERTCNCNVYTALLRTFPSPLYCVSLHAKHLINEPRSMNSLTSSSSPHRSFPIWRCCICCTAKGRLHPLHCERSMCMPAL